MDKLLEGSPETKPVVNQDDEWDSDFPDDEELEEILKTAKPAQTPDTDTPVDAEDDSDATEIDEDNQGEALGYESDRSVDEPETAEDRAFIDNAEPTDETTSHSALLQQKKEDDETAWLQR